MNRIAIPASAIAAARLALNQNRPSLDWGKMKERLGEFLSFYNTIVAEDRKSNPKSTLMPLRVTHETTAKQILWMFMKKFEKGKVKRNQLKFTYSYLADSFGKGFRKLSISTVTRHIQRFLEMPNSFIRIKMRTTLGIPEMDINCIMIELDPRLVVFKDPNKQATHETATDAILSPTVAPKSTEPIHFRSEQPRTIIVPNNAPNQAPVNRRESAKGLGDVVGGILNDLFSPPGSTPKK